MTQKKKVGAPSQFGREKLLRSALRLFATKGFHASSIRDIAADAGFSLGLIRKHYGSKEGLRQAVDAFVIGELQSLYGSYFAASGTDILEDWTRQAAEFTGKDEDALMYLRAAFLDASGESEELFRAYFQIHVDFIDRLRKQGVLRKDTDARWTPYVFMFLQLGPLVIRPYAKAILGSDVYHPATVRERNRAYRKLLEDGLFESKPRR